jgi:hypothetical protein
MQLTDSTKNGSSVMATTAATPEYQRLEIFIGEWIDEGEVIATPDTPPVKILTSDVYEWLPGRLFVAPHRLRTDRRHGFGDTEIIGYDAAGQLHRTHLFDSYGATTTETLTLHDGMWRWQGEKTRAASVFSDDGRRRPACTSARTTA